MEEEIQSTPVVEVNTTPEETAEQTIGDIINPVVEERKPETVGLDKFLEIKKENKELKNQLNDLARRIEEGDNKQDVADDIEALADEHDIDRKFLTKLVKTIESNVEKKSEEKFNSRLAPLTESAKQSKIDTAFKSAFEGTIEQMPEYKNIVNADVIKTLSLDPKNAKKTFSQLIEETYGNAITGKRTLETTKPGGGKEPVELDVNRAKQDPEYFKEVMASPKLRKEYNDGLLDRVSKFL